MAQEQGMSKVGHNIYRSDRDPGDRRWTHVTVLVEFVNQNPSPRWKHPDMPDNGRVHPDRVKQCHMAPMRSAVYCCDRTVHRSQHKFGSRGQIDRSQYLLPDFNAFEWTRPLGLVRSA